MSQYGLQSTTYNPRAPTNEPDEAKDRHRTLRLIRSPDPVKNGPITSPITPLITLKSLKNL